MTRSLALLSLVLAGCGNDSGSGGHVGNGGTTAAGGQLLSSAGVGGRVASGAGPSGGTTAQGGFAGSASGSGGSSENGGTVGSGGGVASGGTVGTGGGSASAAGGGIGLPDAAVGGSTSTGGASGTAGSGGSTGATGPCDIYQSGNTPCVAAHSTVRALYGSYSKNLYQVRRASDNTTKDIPVLSFGGYADSSVQDTFCAGTKCTISIIYDQSPSGNHLTKSPPGGWLHNGGLEADAAAAKVKVGGHTVYGVYTTSNFDNDVGAVGYRNNATKGVATGDAPESMYMVAGGKHYNQWCCFDFRSRTTNSHWFHRYRPGKSCRRSSGTQRSTNRV